MTELKHTDSLYDIGIAVDVGSTTIDVCCVNVTHNTDILSFSFANPQHIYGADVVTRIRYAMQSEENRIQLRDMVYHALKEKLEDYLGDRVSFVKEIVFSGNTTMLHILQGFSVDGLSCAPFTPVSIEAEKKCIEWNWFDEDKIGITCIFLPGISAFVGADILAGAMYLEMGYQDKYDLLVDLGTNGEILLLNQSKGYAASTSCGTVFDSAVTGARYGSECIRVIANCIKRGLINADGVLAEPFFEKGIQLDKGYSIKQDHIRKFQLAKAALYAGIVCLIQEASIDWRQIGKVYISGGLGFYMNIRDAFVVKLLPEELAGKICVSGNSSLEGAKQWLLATDTERMNRMQQYESVKRRTKCIELSNLSIFKDCYIQALDF